AVGVRAVAPLNSCTVLPASALPVILGLLTLVTLSPTVPESVLASRVRPVGAAGAVVSRSDERRVGGWGGWRGPAGGLAVRVWRGWGRAAVRVRSQWVGLSATAVGVRAVVPLNSCTVVPGSAVPVILGWVNLVMLSPRTPESVLASRVRPVGAAGAVVS